MPEIRKYMPFYIMFLPIGLLFIVICYIPIGGLVLSFTQYTPFKGPNFIGLDNFKALLVNQRFLDSFRNTLVLSLVNLFLGVFLAVVISLLLNEVKYIHAKRFVQTIIYLPHFMSWVVVASIFTILLSPQYLRILISNNFMGAFNTMLKAPFFPFLSCCLI